MEFTPMKQGQFCWTEIASNDANKCIEFYSNVFGWKFKKGDGAAGMSYNEFSTPGSDQPAGGLYQIDPAWFGGNPPPAHYMNYVMVDNVDESTKKAVDLGGTGHSRTDGHTGRWPHEYNCRSVRGSYRTF